jgi:hypothetical protein
MRSFIIFTHPQIQLDRSNKGKRGGRGKWNACVTSGKCTRSEGKRPLGRPGRRWEAGIRMDLRRNG